MTTLAPSFSIGSSLVLQVTRTTINLGWVQNWAASDKGLELAALECLEKSP